SLTWARNGELVYTNFDADGKPQVYRITAANPVPECYTSLVGLSDGRYGELSPSGELLALVSPDLNLASTLFVGKLASRTFTALERGVDLPHWAPQGNRVFFVSARDGIPDLWAVDVDPQTGAKSAPARRLTSALGLREFTVAPDGRKVLAVK